MVQAREAGTLVGVQFRYTFSVEKGKVGEDLESIPLYIYPDSELPIDFPEFDEMTFPKAIVDDDYP